jgi:hypothetical protein
MGKENYSQTRRPDNVNIIDIEDTPEFFEDSNFVTGDSPTDLDINTELGRNARKGYIDNDGTGEITVAFRTTGSGAFGDAIRLKKRKILRFDNISTDTIRVTWVSDTSYTAAFI